VAGVGGVVVLDAHGPGWGASGRNGGQVIPGLKYDPDELEAVFGRERGERLWRFAGGTADVVFDLVRRHGLNSGARRTAWVQAVHSAKALERAKRRSEQWQRRGAPVAFLGPAETAAVAGTDRYLGAFVDRRAGSLQPLDYARELARVATARGVRLYGGTRVRALRREEGRWRAETDGGAAATADTVLVCTNACAGRGLVGADLPASIVAANSLQIATEPLAAEHRRRILPGGEVLSDTRKVIRYWRLDEPGRLIMGTGDRTASRRARPTGGISFATSTTCSRFSGGGSDSPIAGAVGSPSTPTTSRGCTPPRRAVWSPSAAKVAASAGKPRWAWSWRSSPSTRPTRRLFR
jgi:glycine/D-amino acid oxidase-like deaminating enzyme